MVEPGQKKSLALDTNFLFDLAKGESFAEDFKEFFQRLGFRFFIPPTVVMELSIASEDEDEEKRKLAKIALSRLIDWQIQPFGMKSVGDDIAEKFSALLRGKGLLPFEEVNDGIILAEAALSEISILVTRDQHLLDIDETSLAVAFNEADLPSVKPAHLKRLLRAAQQIL